MERFTKLSTRNDLNDAIKFEQAASALYPLGHPDRAASLDCLTRYRQLIEDRGIIPRLVRPPGPTDNPTVEQPIGNIIFDVLKAFPPRLLDTQKGTLCSQGAQILHFQNGSEYKQLVSSASALDTHLQTTFIRATLSIYFRYVTLSHRWGKFESLSRDVEKRDTYDLNGTDGLLKLQSFCLACCRYGYLWAWSGTCCIDKESSPELQEAIGSMFLWY